MAAKGLLWNVILFDITDVDEQLLEDRIRKKVFSELRRTTYHWNPLKYDFFNESLSQFAY